MEAALARERELLRLRLPLDEMYSPALAVELRARGHDVVSVHDPGRRLVVGASDPDVLAAAQREERALDRLGVVEAAGDLLLVSK